MRSSTKAKYLQFLAQISLLDIDLQGAQKIHKQFPDYNFLFIDIPTLEELEARLRKRGTETEEVIEKRMKNAEKQLETVKELEYYGHIMNDELEKTKNQLVVYINNLYEMNL